MWDYHGDFGVVPNSQESPPQPDPETVKALGLKK
jgi:hypothetical protein